MRNKTILQVLSILSPSILLRALAMDIFLPCLPSVANEFNVPFSTAQWVLSIYFIGAGLGQFLMGPLADRFGRCKVMQGSLVIFALSSIGCALADSIYMLIFARLLQGLGACGTTVVTLAIVRDLFEDHVTPKVYSYLNGIISLAPILAPIIGGSLLIWTGTWRSCFYFVSVFSLIALAVNYWHLKETNPRFHPDFIAEKINYLANYKLILGNKKFLSYTFCAISGLSGLFLFFSMSSILLIDHLGMAPDIFGYYFGFNSVIYLAGNMLSPSLQRRFGANEVILFGSAFILAGALLMLGWNSLYGLSKLGFVGPNLIMTFGVGMLFGPCIAGSMQQFRHIAGMASASYGALLYCITALIVTAVMQVNIENALPLAATMLVMGSLNVLVVKRQLSIGLRD